MMVKDGQLSYVASSESTISLRLTASTANPARLTLLLFPNTTDLTLSIIVRSSNMLGRIYKFMIGIEALWIPKNLIILFIYPTIFPRVTFSLLARCTPRTIWSISGNIFCYGYCMQC